MNVAAAPAKTRKRKTPRPVGRPRLGTPRPECPHHAGRVHINRRSRNTDKHQTIWFRCIPADGSPAHVFTWETRMRWEVRDPNRVFHCDACRARFMEGFGDHIGWRFEFSYPDVAKTLVRVGEGISFRSAGASIRRETRRWADYRGVVSREARLAQSYVDVFAPLIIDRFHAPEWPAMVAIDALPIKRKGITAGKLATGGVEAGYIYVAADTTRKPARPVLIVFAGGKDKATCSQILQLLPGQPSWIVADGDMGMSQAIDDLGWTNSWTTFYRCEAHLLLNAANAARADKLLEWKPTKHHRPDDEMAELRRLLTPRRGRKKAWQKTELFVALTECLNSQAEWDALKRLVKRTVPEKKKKLRAWITRVEPMVKAQWPLKQGHPNAPYSIGAVENTIRTLTKALENRMVQFGNMPRLNKTLGLIQLQLAGIADASLYEDVIRDHFDANPAHHVDVDWKSHYDHGYKSSIDREVVAAKVRQAKDAEAVSKALDAAKAVRARAQRQARGLNPRQTNPGRAKYRSVVGQMVADLPDVMVEWHPTKNTLDPTNTKASERADAWWLCKRDPSHEWQAEILRRCTKLSGCPMCFHKRATPDYNLAVLFPEIAAQWHPTKNGALRPEEVLPSSDKDRWWICELGHEFELKVGRRTRHNMSCPDEAHRTYTQSDAERRSGRDRERRIRKMHRAGEDLLAGKLDADGKAPKKIDGTTLELARDQLRRLSGALGPAALARLLGRAEPTVYSYQLGKAPSIAVARRVAFLSQLADALGPHADVLAWLERPRAALGDRSAAEILTNAAEWDPREPGPAMLLSLARKKRGSPRDN